VCEPEPRGVALTAPEPERIRTASAAQATAPLVSCVMPTYDRRALVPGAIAGFLRQDHPNAELLVVDDGPESLADLIPDDPRVRHLRLERRLSIGAKRNLGCEAARGALIANWDDDDWYAPWRLSCEIAALEESGADVVGLNHLLYLEPAARRAWRYAWPPHGRPWLHDAVLLFTRDLWRRNPFPDTSRGIDCRFLWSPVRKRIKAIPDERFYVGIIHSTNTSPKNTRHGLWSPHPMQAIEALMGDGASLVAAPS
jgi:glycosyltransferase involved in cell wall biosynthesis